MGYRNPITTASEVDTGRGPSDAGVRLYQDTTNPAVPAGVAEWRTGQMARNATAKLTGGGSGGSAFVIDGGAPQAGLDAPRLKLNVESQPAGGYAAVSRLDGDVVHLGESGGIVVLDGQLAAVATAAPTYSTTLFGPNGVTPLTLTKGADKWVRMHGLARNLVPIGNLVGKWFDLPPEFWPGSVEFGLVAIEEGATGRLAQVRIDTTGAVSGVALIAGAYPIPTPRFWQFDLKFPTP